MDTKENLRGLLGRHDIQIALFTLLGVVLTRVGVPRELQAEVITVLSALALVLIGGQSYVKGKALEGTVPAGQQSTGGRIIIAVNGQSEDQGTQVPLNESLAQTVTEAIQTMNLQAAAKAGADLATPAEKPAVVPPAAVPSNQTAKSVAAVATGLLIGMLAMLGLGGCSALTGSSTQASLPFRVGAAQAGPYLADATAAYVKADHALPADAALAAAQGIRELRAATANKDAIQVEKVAAAWSKIRQLYHDYVAGDEGLSAESKADRLSVPDDFDGLIADERKRAIDKPLFPWSQ